MTAFAPAVGSKDRPFVFIVAGEPSGDALGARLMEALRRRSCGYARFAGVGGPAMTAAGLDSLFAMEELAVMGLIEVLPHARTLLRRVRDVADAIVRLRPDAVVTIDSSGFTYRVARRVRRQRAAIPLIHYVAPQVWAWRPGKAKVAARLFDHLMVLLPFEPPYFEREGLATTYVGHPAMDNGGRSSDGAAFRRRHGIAVSAPLVGLLPGSRPGVVARLLPVFAAAVEQVRLQVPGLRVALPTVASLTDQVTSAAARWSVPGIVVPAVEKCDAFAAFDAALATSGTVTLELAAAGVPFVTAYRAHPVTAAIVRRMLAVRYVTLANVVLDRLAVPEFLQERCTAENLRDALVILLTDDTARHAQREAFAEVRARLRVEGLSPSERAAEVVLSAIRDANAEETAEIQRR
jgi:lipid-A-disaccharide synthase